VRLRLNQNTLADLLKDLSHNLFAAKKSRENSPPVLLQRISSNPGATEDFAFADRSECRKMFWSLGQLCFLDGDAPAILEAIWWIRQNYGKSIDIKRIAAKSAMAVTTFHRRFKQISGLSPIQLQKQLWLLQARKLLAFSGRSVSDTAFRVG
jgi:AraC-like DNA-binding protein